MRRIGPILSWATFLSLVGGSPGVHAEGDISRFRAPMTTNGLLGADAAQELYPGQFSGAAYLIYNHRPLVWRYDADDSYEPIIGQQLNLDLVGAVGVWPRIDVALALPVTLLQQGPSQASLGDTELAGIGLGDLRLMPRVGLVRERSYGFGLAFIPELTIPTGANDRMLGERTVSFRPRLSLSVPRLGPVPVRLIGVVGYHWRKNTTLGDGGTLGDQVALGDEWLFHVGGETPFEVAGIPLTGIVELAGATPAVDLFAADGRTALELLGGLRARVMPDLVLTTGLGVGLTRGVGLPLYRVIVGAAWAPLPPDTDGDGLPDPIDSCPTNPEDYDRFEDHDGCPDLDNDRDGIPDTEDQCPLQPEDFNMVDDEDGCPDAAVVDRDRDGIPDNKDICPTEPEDIDQFEDEDGCPDPDHDHDGVLDVVDQCPTEKETINGVDDEDGCPDEGEGDTEYIEEQRIEIRQTILFETARSTIKAESTPILDQVALQIMAHPEILKIRIEGHTDSRGSEEDNLYLSQDRADSVRRYLVKKGVRKEILEAVGFGETRPIDTNNTVAGRTRNRRVEFVITATR